MGTQELGWEGVGGLHSGVSSPGKGTRGGGWGGGAGAAPGTEDKNPEQQSYAQQQPEDDGHNLSSGQDPGNCRHTR